jgi:hypothetical protein
MSSQALKPSGQRGHWLLPSPIGLLDVDGLANFATATTHDGKTGCWGRVQCDCPFNPTYESPEEWEQRVFECLWRQIGGDIFTTRSPANTGKYGVDPISTHNDGDEGPALAPVFSFNTRDDGQDEEEIEDIRTSGYSVYVGNEGREEEELEDTQSSGCSEHIGENEGQEEEDIGSIVSSAGSSDNDGRERREDEEDDDIGSIGSSAHSEYNDGNKGQEEDHVGGIESRRSSVTSTKNTSRKRKRSSELDAPANVSEPKKKSGRRKGNPWTYEEGEHLFRSLITLRNIEKATNARALLDEPLWEKTATRFNETMYSKNPNHKMRTHNACKNYVSDPFPCPVLRAPVCRGDWH